MRQNNISWFIEWKVLQLIYENEMRIKKRYREFIFMI